MRKNIFKLFTIVLILCVGISSYFSIQYAIKLVTGYSNLGIPAKFVNHKSKTGDFTISLPETWAPMDMTGNHGDKNIVLTIRNLSETLYIDVSKYEPINSQHDVENIAIEKIIIVNKETYKAILLKQYQGNEHSGLIHEYRISNTHPFLGKRDFHCVDWYVNPQINLGYSFSFCVEEKKLG